MGMVAAISYGCPWSGCEWSVEFPYRPIDGVYPNPSEVERLAAAHINVGHAGRVPDVINGRPDPRQHLDARDPRCSVPSRYGEPCETRKPDAVVRGCKFCGRPM